MISIGEWKKRLFYFPFWKVVEFWVIVVESFISLFVSLRLFNQKVFFLTFLFNYTYIMCVSGLIVASLRQYYYLHS